MGRHTLKEGKEVIAAILELGETLGYVVKEEFPIEKKSSNPPAVDAAWLSEENHDFPLMIFEVESKVTSSIAHNATKVFGQPNEEFEKPLFFFHIFLKGPRDSSKTSNLKRLFGLYNYRAYDFSKKNDLTRLIIDILSQHRRLYRKMDLANLVAILEHEIFVSADLDKVLMHIETLRFQADYLKDYASLFSKEKPHFRKHYLRFLVSYVAAYPDDAMAQEYDTYWGYTWSVPIHYGILIHSFPQKKLEYFRAFQKWQEENAYLTMIGPHFGLSRDYDEFILCLSPPFWAFLSALMKDSTDGVLYIADQCQLILEKMREYKPRISFFMATWLLHIAAAVSSERHFEYARAIIEDAGGISKFFLYNPPSSISIEGKEEVEGDRQWSQDFQKNSAKIPDLSRFKVLLQEKVKISNCKREDAVEFAFKVLLDQGIHSNWAHPIVAMLAF